MKLTLDDIKKITVGALHVWEENHVFRFAKCTPKQVAAWYEVDEVLGERSEATTGVRLDFYTNSHYFVFKTNTIENHEIYIDNVLTYVYFKEDLQNSQVHRIALDGKEHRITLYLPSHGIPGALEYVEIEDGATLKPHEFDCKMLFIGDSITQGWESTWDSLSYAYHVSRFFNANSVIQGIGGSMFHKTTFDEDIPFEPDIVIVAYGTNDWGYAHKTIEDGREHCCKYLDQLVARYGDKKLFGITPIWRGDSHTDTAMGSFEACKAYVKEEIINHGMILIEGDTLTPHMEDFYADKFLHPNACGFGIYALNLIAQIQKNL